MSSESEPRLRGYRGTFAFGPDLGRGIEQQAEAVAMPINILEWQASCQEL